MCFCVLLNRKLPYPLLRGPDFKLSSSGFTLNVRVTLGVIGVLRWTAANSICRNRPMDLHVCYMLVLNFMYITNNMQMLPGRLSDKNKPLDLL